MNTKQTLVVKLGTSVLTAGSKKLNKAKVLLGSVVVVVILAYLLNSIINLIKNVRE